MSIGAEIQNNKDDLIKIDVQHHYTPSGRVSNKLIGHIEHRGLKVERKILETDIALLQKKLNDQMQKWVEEWSVIQKNNKLTEQSKAIKNILVDKIGEEVSLNWEELKNYAPFPKNKPIFADSKPLLSETLPNPGFLDKLFKSHLEKMLVKQEKNFKLSLKSWENKKAGYQKELKAWESEEEKYLQDQEKYNQKVDEDKKKFEKLNIEGVEQYFQVVLQRSSYPLSFEKKIAIEYTPGERMLVVEYFMPNIESYPKVKELRYLKTNGSTKELEISVKERDQKYEELLYNIVLRTMHELFKSDYVSSLKHIVFNGWVNNVNKATGKKEDLCILSIMVEKEEFLDVDLREVEPKACFKKLKGVAASEISMLTPIPPILQIRKEDKRFVQEQVVGENLDDSVNLAAMDWQDFEHLIRELFEKEYGLIGGEVKITQSSRDKGVDVVAFDPDPIRGGKIIIQAKRYTNTVHIESVRALYGIMQDEGAMKGILITTSDFGADAYSFAKDKPITLLNGGNLLSMFNKHGYHGKIDLREAKLILGKDANL